MPSDVAPKPAVSSPILDRFHLLMKEIESDLIRVTNDAAAVPTTEDVVRVYEDVLSELSFNSKPLITDLTILAGEVSEHAEGIAEAICARILEVPVEQKLPSLYLLDSIVKNIGGDYVRHFASRLPEVFCEAYRQVPSNMHSSMRHLFGTWSSVFSSPVLGQIEDDLQISPRLNQPSSSLSSMNALESPRPPHGIHVNPKYLEARRQSDSASVKNNNHRRGVPNVNSLSQKHPIGYEDYDYDQGEGSDAPRFFSTGNRGRMPFPSSVDKLRPSVSGPVRPLSPSTEEYAVSNSPGRVFDRLSPSHYGRRVRGRDEEIVDWQKRRRSNDFNRGHENIAPYGLSNGFDHDSSRALIDAYGHDDGQRSQIKKPVGLDRRIVNGAKVADNSWQNTEEEEFDWEDMSPTLADGKTSNFSQPFDHSTRGSNQANSININMLRAEDSLKVIKDANQIQDGAWNAPTSLSAAKGETASHLNLPTNGAPIGRVHPQVSSGFETRPELASLWPGMTSQPGMPSPPVPASFTVLNQGPQQFDIDAGRNSVPMNPAHRPRHNFLPPHHPSRPPVLLMPNILLPPERRHNVVPMVQPVQLPANISYTPVSQVANDSNSRNNPMPAFHPSFQNVSNGPVPFQRHPPPMHQRPYPHIVPLPRLPGPPLNQPVPGDISSLYNSLASQGLLPLTQTTSKQGSLGVDFDPDLLKMHHESPIRALYEDLPRQCTTCGLRFKTQEEHRKHMDWHVTKNRMSRSRKHNPSRKWFVNTSMWLSGTEAMGTDAAPGFLPTETPVEKKDDEELAVPADEEQKVCALCGEAFEDFYSDETEEWMYRGAVYLNTPCSGSTLGMDRSQLGPIVHAKCRSESSAAPS